MFHTGYMHTWAYGIRSKHGRSTQARNICRYLQSRIKNAATAKSKYPTTYVRQTSIPANTRFEGPTNSVPEMNSKNIEAPVKSHYLFEGVRIRVREGDPYNT